MSKSVPIAELVSDTVTTPSILASNLSNWAWVNVKAAPSNILKVNPAGKLVSEDPYLLIIASISEPVPVTISSMFPILWKAIELVDQVLLSVLSNEVPDIAPMYSSQLNWIFPLASEVLVMLLIYPFADITDEEVFVMRDLILSVVSEIVRPEAKLSDITFWLVAASKAAREINCAAVIPEDAKDDPNVRLEVTVLPEEEAASINVL